MYIIGVGAFSPFPAVDCKPNFISANTLKTDQVIFPYCAVPTGEVYPVKMCFLRIFRTLPCMGTAGSWSDPQGSVRERSGFCLFRFHAPAKKGGGGKLLRYYEKRFRAGALPAMELTRPVTCRGARLLRYGVRNDPGASVVYGTVDASEEAAAEHLFGLWVKSVLLEHFLETAPPGLAPAAELHALTEDFCRDRALVEEFLAPRRQRF